MQLSLYVVPMICEPLVGQPITACVETHRHLASLELADCSDGELSMEVDILIGSDYYWDLVTGGVCQGDGGPTAIHSKLGWVLSGPAQSTALDQCSMNLVATHVLRIDSQQNNTRILDDRLRSLELESLGICNPE